MYTAKYHLFNFMKQRLHVVLCCGLHCTSLQQMIKRSLRLKTPAELSLLKTTEACFLVL